MTAIFACVCDGTPEHELWKLQALGVVCLAWEVDELWYVDATAAKGGPLGPVQFHERRLKARQVESLAAALDDAKDLRPVVVEGPMKQRADAKELRGYVHPADALYLFGSDRGAGLWPALAKVEADWLMIPARRGVYGFLAAAVVAQHRAMQANRLR